MLPDNSERLTQLARERHDQTLQRATIGLASMPPGEVVTVGRLAAKAGLRISAGCDGGKQDPVGLAGIEQ